MLSRGNQAGLDDYLTLFSLTVNVATCIAISIAVDTGLGKHVKDVPLDNLIVLGKRTIIMNALTVWTFSLPKLALVALLKRILNYGYKTAIIFWTLCFIAQACTLATSVIWFERCQPVAHQWDPEGVPGNCFSIGIITNLGYFTSAFSAFLDLVFAFYPIPTMMKLNMSLHKRTSVSIGFGLGSLAFAVSVYKMSIYSDIVSELAVDRTCEPAASYFKLERRLTSV